MYTKASLMKIIFAINFIENNQKISYNTSKVHNWNDISNNKKISKNINNIKVGHVNSIHRASHHIGQPQWRGYSH
jgi:hypothetical protein